jgi:hypothetical protein
MSLSLESNVYENKTMKKNEWYTRALTIIIVVNVCLGC